MLPGTEDGLAIWNVPRPDRDANTQLIHISSINSENDGMLYQVCELSGGGGKKATENCRY